MSFGLPLLIAAVILLGLVFGIPLFLLAVVSLAVAAMVGKLVAWILNGRRASI